jgi:hypothetical protein
MEQKFHERFDIDVGGGEARRRFVNRVHNDIFDGVIDRMPDNPKFYLTRFVASSIGERHEPYARLVGYVREDFFRCLEVLEACVSGASNWRREISAAIYATLGASEVDLGIEWTGTIFRKTGAPALDAPLVNEPLGLLADDKYATVLMPFQKGLQHLLQSNKHPEVLADVVTDMYEALEALAKVVTGRADKDLSANAELFLSKTGASVEFKNLLKAYIGFANEFRHARRPGEPREVPSFKEAESFVYLTGLFIRVALL